MSAQDRQTQIARFVERAYGALDRVDYYRLLGVSSAATETEIREAYYKLAQHLHPDIHGVDIPEPFRLKLTAVFSRVVEAYKALSDGPRREAYDRGLARGSLRLKMGVEIQNDRPEARITDPGALKFYRLARAAREGGDLKSALMNLRLALSVEPDNTVLQSELADLEKGAT